MIDRRCIRTAGGGNEFGILLKERSSGWRIGYLIMREKYIKSVECHPDSLETFEPVSGRSIIALSKSRQMDKFKYFLLDRPIVLKKNIWHGIAALSRKCEIKIFENIEVKTVRIDAVDQRVENKCCKS
jgi:hypothetical protein